MNHDDETPDEAQFAKLLAAHGEDGVPLDAAYLARLREATSAAFLQADLNSHEAPAQVQSDCDQNKESAMSAVTLPRPVDLSVTPANAIGRLPQNDAQPANATRRIWATTILRVAAIGIAAALLFAVFNWRPRLFATGPTIGEVLRKTTELASLHAQLVSGEATNDIFIKQSYFVRWDRNNGTYSIMRGSQSWDIDESQNLITHRQSADPEFPSLLHYVGVSDHTKGYSESNFALPHRSRHYVERDGRDYLFYEFQHPSAGQYEFVEVLVDPIAHTVHSLRRLLRTPGGDIPQAELTVLAINQPIPDSKFEISDTLTADGRIGKVTDVQGVVGIKPVLVERWSPVCKNLVIKPGDLLRTEIRGANAVAVRLVKDTRVLLGPGTQVELIKPAQLRIFSGELEISLPEKTEFELLGPDNQKVAITGTAIYRLRGEQLVRVEKEPLWLSGFKGTTTNESIGALIANIDGRNVPLTVGYHKVSVEIRDQIARTTIEESFVNRTDSQLEGVFHFPLPQDASISGFGMWIGDELVEADVVEKQRAREIYETILRERRDPGLLEWTGGNLFKARVFPIFPHSEKRIKITYTQVLPLRGNQYRYSYALQSELLKQYPLRELSIRVKLNSALPLAGVECPTHPTRLNYTQHAASAEFSAQEYTPTRDFELVVSVDATQSDVVVVPHRRGDDGYLMVQLMPPAAGGAWQREVLPESEPRNWLILADTSLSMDASSRKQQAEFVAALLGTLSPKDTLNLAGCDVNCDWVFTKPQPADAKNQEAIREFLEKRRSLGWSDLDKAFQSAFDQARLPGRLPTHLIYLGDGVITTGDADPAAFAKRLLESYQAHFPPTTQETEVRCHAIAVSSSFESGVLKAIGSLGGGSLRRITGEQGPAEIALELLREVSQPGLRDLQVEFRGLKTARVYPEQLANVPAGTQQILIGRYLPEGRDQVGEVVVTGTLAGKPVRYSSKLTLRDAEQGNSFIPRLWARQHLDHLLEQGSSQAIQDEIIALSEEYQIMTPYTSFLVLETDADRERFKVQRRFQMRDGEKFFNEGQQHANYELAQAQMKKAAQWRTALRRSVLAQLATLGRDVRQFQPRSYNEYLGGRGGWTSMLGGRFDSGPTSSEWRYLGVPASGPVSSTSEAIDYLERDLDGEDFSLGDLNGLQDSADKAEDSVFVGESLRAEAKRLSDSRNESLYELDAGMPLEMGLYDAEEFGEVAGQAVAERAKLSRPSGGAFGLGGEPYFYRGRRSLFRYSNWHDTLLPPIPSVASQPAVKTAWPAEAKQLAESLLRTDSIGKLTGGIEIVRSTSHHDPRWNEPQSQTAQLELFGPSAWLIRSGGNGSQTSIDWCNAKERGRFSLAYLLGRMRAATPADLGQPSLGLADYSLNSIERSFPGSTAQLEPHGPDRTRILVRYPNNKQRETRAVIDTVRHVLVSIETHDAGKLLSRTAFSDFIEVGGSWWARRLETTNADGKLTSLITQTIRELDAAGFPQRVNEQLAVRNQVQFLRQPSPSVRDAKRALAEGNASFDDRFALLVHFEGSQQWTRVMEHLAAMEQLAANKLGMQFIRDSLLLESRRHEELRQRILAASDALVKPPADDRQRSEELFLANWHINQAGSVLSPQEMLELLNRIKPLFERQPPLTKAMKSWRQMEANHLAGAGQPDVALERWKSLASDYPREYDLQRQYAQQLVNQHNYAAAYTWLDEVLAGPIAWLPNEEEVLRVTNAQFMQSQGRFQELAEYLAPYIARNPESSSAYGLFLMALVRSNQMEQFDATIAQWIKAGLADGELPPAVLQRFQAAVSQVLGQGYHMYSNYLDPKWLTLLGDVVLTLARQDKLLHVAQSIYQHSTFARSEQANPVRRELTAMLQADVETLSVDQLAAFINWGLANHGALDTAACKQIAAKLQQRWAAEADLQTKYRLSEALLQLLYQRATVPEVLAFLRLRYETADDDRRAAFALALFQNLWDKPWTTELETECFALLDKLSNAEEPGERLLSYVSHLHQLNDRLIEARYAALMSEVKEQEKLSRTELKEKQDAARKSARAGLADTLKELVAKAEKPHSDWLEVERLWLEMLLDRDPQAAAAGAWTSLDRQLPAPAAEDRAPGLTVALAELLRRRHLLTLMNLAARKNAQVDLLARLEQYLAARIAADEDDQSMKLRKFQFLLSLNRVEQLQANLQAWITQDDPDHRWRLALGYLHAEQGQVAEAIKLFEGVELADELGPTAYRALADWYLAADRRTEHERAAIRSYMTMEEWQLDRLIRQRLAPWQRHDQPLPGELDDDVLRLFAALFAKSESPQSYLWQLQQFYQATRDYRLLAGLADAVIGQTAGKVYPFLGGMSSVLHEIRNEATADSIIEQIAVVRAKAKTSVDQRALDLLELLIERRAAEVLNQPGPHAVKAIAALDRAMTREWTQGEPRLVAELLANLGRIAEPRLAERQLAHLAALDQASKPGSFDRLQIAWHLARANHAHGKVNQAIDRLKAALAEFEMASNGHLPVSAQHVLDAYIDYLESAGQFVKGESVLAEHLKRPLHEQQRHWLSQRRHRLHIEALRRDGEVSFGKGTLLYQAAHQRLIAEMETSNQDHRYQLINLLCNLADAGHEKKIARVGSDLENFASKRLPELLKRQTNNHVSLVNQVANTLGSVQGRKSGLAFLITQIESEPQWLRYQNQDGWSQFGGTIAQWRSELKQLGDLEPRLEQIVLAELRRDLTRRESRNRQIYHDNYSHFWEEKRERFARVAEQVYAEQKASGEAVKYIADYLYHGLDKHARAIDMLAAAHEEKLLDEQGQSQFVQYLHGRSRYAESIGLLQALVELNDDNLNYRVWLMHAYFRTNRQNELLALLKQTDEFFHQQGRWTESAIAQLAYSCLQNRLFPESIAYYKELIPLHERTQPRRGIGNGTLSRYYQYLAQAHAGIDQTIEAAEAASMAIVSWGPRHAQREEGLATLRNVLSQAKDLEAYIAHLDKQATETGQDSPLIRKAAGQAYLEVRRDPAKARMQLQKAVELQPNDAQTHQLLLSCFDQLKDRQGAVEQILASLELQKRQVELYGDLAKRLTDLNQPGQAERAITSLVESMPNETEGHAALAEARQKQGRWADAALHWEQVARLRALEPTGLLKLAAAQIELKRWDEAEQTIKKLQSQGWPSRFGNVDQETRNLDRRLQSARAMK